MPVLASIRERFAAERPLDGVRRRGVPARDGRDGEPRARAGGGRGARRAVRGQPAVDAGRHRRGAAPRTGVEVRARHGEDLDAYAAHVAALVAAEPQVTLDDGADLVTVLHATRPEAARRMLGGTEETTTGPAAPARDAGRGPPALPDPGGQRGAHRARLQRPLRHGPVDPRRHPARDEPAARRAHVRRPGLRQHRARRRAARARRRRLGGRLRDRPGRGARGADGGLRGAARPAGGRARGRLRHRHGRPRRPAPRALRAHEGRRGAGQRGALRRRARPRRAARAGRGRRAPRAPARRPVRPRRAGG